MEMENGSGEMDQAKEQPNKDSLRASNYNSFSSGAEQKPLVNKNVLQGDPGLPKLNLFEPLHPFPDSEPTSRTLQSEIGKIWQDIERAARDHGMTNEEFLEALQQVLKKGYQSAAIVEQPETSRKISVVMAQASPTERYDRFDLHSLSESREETQKSQEISQPIHQAEDSTIEELENIQSYRMS
jgi:hypothetical protein